MRRAEPERCEEADNPEKAVSYFVFILKSMVLVLPSDWPCSLGRVGEPELGLKFNPQCQLPDAVSAGVTEASGKNLSECAVAARSPLSQIVARIIEVRVVQNIGKATLELECDPLRHVESLAKAEVPGNSSRAYEGPYTCVAKAANDIALVRVDHHGAGSKILACGAAGTGEYVRIPPLSACMANVIRIASQVRPVKAKIGVSGGIKLHEGSIKGARFSQEDRAELPAPQYSVHHSIGIAKESTPLPNRNLLQ